MTRVDIIRLALQEVRHISRRKFGTELKMAYRFYNATRTPLTGMDYVRIVFPVCSIPLQQLFSCIAYLGK